MAKGVGREKVERGVKRPSSATGRGGADKSDETASMMALPVSGSSASVASASAPEHMSTTTVGDGSKRYTRQAIAKRRQRQAETYTEKLCPFRALAGESMRGPVYQAVRTLKGLESSGKREGSEYIELQARLTFTQLCEKMSDLPSMSPTAEREAELAQVISQVSPLPEDFQLAILETRVKELALTSKEAVTQWLNMISPRPPAEGGRLHSA